MRTWCLFGLILYVITTAQHKQLHTTAYLNGPRATAVKVLLLKFPWILINCK